MSATSEILWVPLCLMVQRADRELGARLVVGVASEPPANEQASAEAKVREVDALADYHRAIASYRAATARDLGP